MVHQEGDESSGQQFVQVALDGAAQNAAGERVDHLEVETGDKRRHLLLLWVAPIGWRKGEFFLGGVGWGLTRVRVPMAGCRRGMSTFWLMRDIILMRSCSFLREAGGSRSVQSCRASTATASE